MLPRARAPGSPLPSTAGSAPAGGKRLIPGCPPRVPSQGIPGAELRIRDGRDSAATLLPLPEEPTLARARRSGPARRAGSELTPGSGATAARAVREGHRLQEQDRPAKAGGDFTPQPPGSRLPSRPREIPSPPLLHPYGTAKSGKK